MAGTGAQSDMLKDAQLDMLKDEICALNTQVAEYRAQSERLTMALTESVNLQSHYASLLNMYDGGQRMQFADARAWMNRLERVAR